MYLHQGRILIEPDNLSNIMIVAVALFTLFGRKLGSDGLHLDDDTNNFPIDDN